MFRDNSYNFMITLSRTLLKTIINQITHNWHT